MTRRLRSRCAYPLLAAAAVFAILAPAPAFAADKPKLELRKGDRIILIGNTLAERMQYYGHFETLLHARFPELALVVHNLGYSADELTLRPRQAHFNDHGHTLENEKPDVLVAVFGFNESFAGPASLGKFKNDLEKFIKDSTTTNYNGKKAPILVLFSPIAHEDLKNPHITDGKKNNENIKLYADAMAELASKHGVVFVDLFTPSKQLYEAAAHPLTINGIHLSDEGYRQLAPKLDEALFGPVPTNSRANLQALHAAVQEKNLQFFYDYRAVNGCYIYTALAGRRRSRHCQLPGRDGQATQDDSEPGRNASGRSPRARACRPPLTTVTPASS